MRINKVRLVETRKVKVQVIDGRSMEKERKEIDDTIRDKRRTKRHSLRGQRKGPREKLPNVLS